MRISAQLSSAGIAYPDYCIQDGHAIYQMPALPALPAWPSGVHLASLLCVPHHAAQEWSLGAGEGIGHHRRSAEGFSFLWLSRGSRPPARRGLLLAMAGGFLAARIRTETFQIINISIARRERKREGRRKWDWTAGRPAVFHVFHCHGAAHLLR